MDFRNCPSCKASVLEDDVEDCPFCGASMSGKPSSKPAAAKPKPAPAKAAAAAKPQAAPASAGAKSASPAAPKARPTPEELDDGTDPFEVDTKATLNVPAVSSKPAKGRMLRIVCPMCETPGFIAPQQQGKEVKCCNPQCIMPVFTAPKPKEVKVEEPPKRSTSTLVFAAIAAVLIIGVGIGLYQFLLKPTGKTKSPLDDIRPRATAKNGEPVEIIVKSKEPTALAAVTLDEIRSTSLTQVEKAAQQTQNNRSKPFGRQMSAETFADAGEFAKAREQLADMQKVQGYVAYYEIVPLVEIATGLAASGDAAGAKAALDEALTKTELPKYGREPLDASSTLATALVEAGRIDEAQRVAGLADDSELRGRALALWRNAIDSGSLDLDAPYRRPYLNEMPSAQWVSVTDSLVVRGHSAEALQWAQLATNPSVRDNALAAWAGGVTRKSNVAPGELAPAEVTTVLPNLSPAAQARIWATIAQVWQSQKNDAAAGECLTKATAALESIPAPTATMPVPSMKAIHDSEGQPRAGLPDPAEARSAALAAADIAEVRASLGDIPGAWSSLARGLAYLRGSAPSPVAVQQLVDQADNNQAEVKAQLKAALTLDDSRVFNAFNDYSKQCDIVLAEANSRWNLQVQLMRRAAARGVLQPLWDEVVAREQQADIAEREPYFDTLLPSTIVAYATAGKQADIVKNVQQTVPADKQKVDQADRVAILFPPLVAAGKMRDAADLLRSFDSQSPGNWTTSIEALAAVSRLIKAGQLDKAMEFVGACTNPLIREDALQLIAAAAVRDGKHSDLWRKRTHYGLTATELASFYRGCVRGMSLRPAPTPEEQKTAAQ